MAEPFVSAGAHAPHSDERLGPTPSRGPSHSARRLRSLAFLGSSVEVDKARLQVAATLPPADALRSLGNPQVLIVDKTQRLPEASRIVKGWHDAHLPVRILLLGSSSLNLLD